MYQPVVCGGDSLIRDAMIHEFVISKAKAEVEDHPCGCEVCLANHILMNLYQERIKAGVNPYTGRSI